MGIRAAAAALGVCLGLLGWTGIERANNAHSQSLPASMSTVAGQQEELSSFDWRSSRVVTPVRSQKGCAAGWAFAATAMLESAVARDTGRQVNLSEQYLLNCGGPDYTCRQGGWGALDLFQSVYLPPQTAPGAVLESALPYRGVSAACKRAYTHPYRIDRWGFVNSEGASVEEIKQALLEYGPLAASLCAGPVFQAYRSGVYDSDESALCDRQGQATNHAVLITGWDDLRGCWRIKNSWGTGWGQGGFGCARYGVSRIGLDALYLVYRSAPGKPALLQPGSGAVIRAGPPRFTWKAAAGHADGYQIQLARDAAFGDLLLEDMVDGPAYTPLTELPADARIYWRVRAWRGPLEEVLYGPWSAARSIRTLPPIPAPLRPLDLTVDSLRPVFEWEGSGQRYDIQIARTETCGRALRSASVSTASYTPGANLPRASALFWRVRARGKYGASPWSACTPFWTP